MATIERVTAAELTINATELSIYATELSTNVTELSINATELSINCYSVVRANAVLLMLLPINAIVTVMAVNAG